MGTEYGVRSSTSSTIGTFKVRYMHTRATFTAGKSTRVTGKSRYRELAAAPVHVRVLVPVHALAGGPPPGRGERGRGAVAKFECAAGRIWSGFRRCGMMDGLGKRELELE